MPTGSRSVSPQIKRPNFPEDAMVPVHWNRAELARASPPHQKKPESTNTGTQPTHSKAAPTRNWRVKRAAGSENSGLRRMTVPVTWKLILVAGLNVRRPRMWSGFLSRSQFWMTSRKSHKANWHKPLMANERRLIRSDFRRVEMARGMLLAHMGTVMTTLDQEIAAYEIMRPDLENRHMGEWVLVSDEKLIGVFSSFDEAAKEAVQRFGRGPYLIRQIGAPPVTMPASVVYHLQHA